MINLSTFEAVTVCITKR